jgi:hypothetical protein
MTAQSSLATAAAVLSTLPHIDDHEQYRGENQKLVDLQRQQADLDGRMNDIREGLSQAGTKTVREHAAELLENGSTSTFASPAAIADRQLEYRNLSAKKRIVEEAIVMQREILAKLRGKVSAEVCRQFVPAHRASVRIMLEAVVKIAVENQREEELLRELDRLGYTYEPSFREYRLRAIGNSNDYDSPANVMLRDAIEHGHLDRDDPLVKVGNTLRGRDGCLPEVKARMRAIEGQRLDAERRRKHGPDADEIEAMPNDERPGGRFKRFMRSLGAA